LPGKQPTSRADKTLLHTQDDASVANANGAGYSNSYRSKDGYPWVLDIPILWDYPSERLIVTKAYSEIAAWAHSTGATNANWYLSPVSADKTFRNDR
jgi:LruC domain-containing protein